MYFQLTSVNTISTYPINVLLNVLIKASIQWVSYYAFLPFPKTLLYFKITLLLPELLAEWSIACFQSGLCALIHPSWWVALFNYTLIPGPAGTVLHNMASNPPTWSHHSLFTSITSPELFSSPLFMLFPLLELPFPPSVRMKTPPLLQDHPQASTINTR